MLTLNPSDSRGHINRAQAVEMTKKWFTCIRECQYNYYSNTLKIKIILTNQSYSPEAAKVIADFIASTELFDPCLASRVVSLDMSDVIAGQKKEDGLAVLQTLAQAFATSSSLQHLDLSENAMGPLGISCCEAFFMESRILKSLSLCNNGLSLEAMCQVAAWLVERRLAPNLEKLHFFNNMSGDDGCEAFQHILNHSTPSSLSSLRYASTRASFLGSKMIMTGLLDFVRRVRDGHVASMTFLDLTDNKLKGENAHLLAQALHAMPHLQYINLSECDMKNQGLHAISCALIDHKCITHLDLSGNKITEDGVSADSPFIQLLMNIAPNLRVLNIQSNRLTSKGVVTIVRALSRGPCVLNELALGDNEFGPNCVAALIRSADFFLPTLEYLRIEDNFLSHENVEGLLNRFGTVLHGYMENNELSDFEDTCVEADIDDEGNFEAEREQSAKEEKKMAELSRSLSMMTAISSRRCSTPW
jgi:Ran GTPase-activating protein (RanGAP) involved in mRNA processing and transport